MKKNKTDQNDGKPNRIDRQTLYFKSNSQNTPCTAQGKVYIELNFRFLMSDLLG